MRVLLTGAAGFIGGQVAERLAAAGHDIVGVDVLLDKAHLPGTDLPAGVQRLDVRDATGLDAVLPGTDVVCHQAAMVGNGVDAQDLPGYAAHNDLGTAVLLAAMARAGVRALVLASSMVVYGEGRYTCPDHGEVTPLPRRGDDLDAGRFDPRCPRCSALLSWGLVPESAPIRPRSSYAVSKVAQEQYAQAWSTLTDGRCIALRYHNVYGPGMPADTPYSGVAAVFRSAMARGQAPRVFEDGGQMRDFVHVADVARANVAALGRLADHPVGLTPYNVCSGQPRTIGQLADALAEAVGGPRPVVTGEHRAADVRHVVAAPDAAREGLGFQAAVAPEEGLRVFAGAPLRPTR
ncbi:MAG: NAD-dependent epimerase/dehydratase family protein [Actinomycetota bacterium]|nr:NAD-dependent epimerase/dehydratase family protein [Actinomycetota bacterium]